MAAATGTWQQDCGVKHAFSFVVIIFSQRMNAIGTISSNFRYIFNQPNNLFTDYQHPFVHNIHCIATHTIIGIPLTFLLTNGTVQCSLRSDCMSACRHRDGALLWRHVNTMFPVASYKFLPASVSFTFFSLSIIMLLLVYRGKRFFFRIMQSIRSGFHIYKHSKWMRPWEKASQILCKFLSFSRWVCQFGIYTLQIFSEMYYILTELKKVPKTLEFPLTSFRPESFLAMSYT